MKKAIKKLWVEALRSGKFKKGKGALHPTKGTYCCLGVLCELHRTRLKKPKDEWEIREVDGEKRFVYKGQKYSLPLEVREWAGLNNSDPIPKDNLCLSEANDGINGKGRGLGFKKIADLIEEHL
jgi:hypothetical protein